MNAELAKHALVFLARCDLKGAEYPALHTVVQALEALIRAHEAPPAPAAE